MLVTLRNAGNQPAANVNVTLRSGHPLFTIMDSTAAFGDIPACSTRTNSGDALTVSVDAGIPLETPVACTLFVNGTGYCDTLRFTVVVGQIRQVDPIPDGPRQPALYWAYDDVDTYYTQHPDFNWVEIRGLGTQLLLGDDETRPVDLPAGFVWNYYGQSNNQVSICGNGWVAPGYSTNTAYTNTSLPSTYLTGAVCLNWDDLYPPYGGGVLYYDDAANHRFVIEYDSVAYFGAQTVFDKFELVIYDTTVHTPSGDNVVLVQYLTANGYGSNTVGIQDPTVQVAIQCLLDGAYHRGTAPLDAGRAIKYTTDSPSTGIAEGRRTPYASGITLRAYPNPFRSTVALTLNATGPASARVFDNTGRVVRTLKSNSPLTWDGRDDSGRAVAPGIYFCRVATGTTEAQTKVVLSR